MIRIFITLYRFFRTHRITFYALCILLPAVMVYLALQIRLEEDINSFMPQTEDTHYTGKVFKNIKVKDKIAVLVTSRDTAHPATPGTMIEGCEAFFAQLQQTPVGKSHIKKVQSTVDNRLADLLHQYVMEHLPVFLDTASYARLDSLLQRETMEKHMARQYAQLLSPWSMVSAKFLAADPLGLSGNIMKDLAALELDGNYTIYDEHIFSDGKQYLVAFISPVFGAGELSNNEVFVEEIERTIAVVEQQFPALAVSYFGGIPVGVYNARQIKSDAFLAMMLTALVIGLVIFFAFRRRLAIPLILLPVLMGGLFALALMYLLQGAISTIAIGAGSVILGVALSYSIHVFCHSLHARSAEQVIRELAYPMTIGSFTTIAAFASLTFMHTEALHDFGLFSCFTLIGTTLCCLVFIPHLLSFQPQQPSRLMRLIEKWNAYPFEKNYIVIGLVALVFGVSCFFCGKVTFHAGMEQLNYMPAALAQAEEVLKNAFQGDCQTVYFVATGNTPDEALSHYRQAAQKCHALKEKALVKEYSSAHHLLLPVAEQQRRIDLWNRYWTPGKRALLKKNLLETGEKYTFKAQNIDAFLQRLDKEYQPVDYTQQGFLDTFVLNDWIDYAGGLPMAIIQAQLPEENKEQVYRAFGEDKNIVILDKAYFAGKLSALVNEDFNVLLYIVSIIVFLSILTSYGRIEIAIVTFLPMVMSWVIILGLMALFGIEFNVINIILSTFIFGIGDDFSIFVSDGLLLEYKTGQRILTSHKTAIFFSAFAVTAGMGAMIFSKHPALYSVSITSMIGMGAVILIAYTVQPFLFRLFITGRTAKRKFPHTWYSLFMTVMALTIFVAGCLLLTVTGYMLMLFPASKKSKQVFFHHLLYYFSFLQIYAMPNEKKVRQNPAHETFGKPAVIIANHQSVIDILQMLTLHPKIIMVTKEWVSHSPLFGKIARFAGFVDITKGYEPAVAHIRQYMDEGYSVVIFPEGTRSPDGKLQRFHKGAFYLAEALKADIIPVLLYGHGQAMSKDDYLYLKDATLATKILPRIPYREGETYRERHKQASALFRKEHAAFVEATDRSGNPYHRYKLMKNYLYKGAVLEWYLRIKAAMEKNYKLFEQLVPARAVVTDIGCGYGFLCYMLAFRSDEREITGIDYDAGKIATAQHNFSKTRQLQFIAADISEYAFPPSDVFILNDVLHYLPGEKQYDVLARCVQQLRPGGKIIIRDGDREKSKKHALTRLSEFFSVKLLNFNKADGALHFMTISGLEAFAQRHNLSLSIVEESKYSSNLCVVLIADF
ncbi:MAG: 1-acyl-sn-glycerol-3-phosphate acyltransferase [Prevotellaceae bacterium]|jgi:1-acyl-sn-glycerol-3-phosphate acyltransferase|nr:1-acyl-sn-glycerol-3-phosphate acyltransferase [Prevotellaceae bacterium]